MINFYDTSSLLIKIPDTYFYISSITLLELEGIKTSFNKDQDIKERARKVSNYLANNPDKFKVVRYTPDLVSHYLPAFLDINNNDVKILSCAIYQQNLSKEELKIFTNDINLFLFCRELQLTVEQIKDEKWDYNGIFEISLSDDEMADYYSNLNSNYFNLYKGQQAIIRDSNNEVVDMACWDGEKMRALLYDDITSGSFGRLKPKRNDPYQACLFDSLQHNQVNLITGKAGSGKTLLALAYLFSLLDHKIDRIVIFCNPVVVRGSCKLGFYPGTVTEKLLSTQVGNILTSKLGDQMFVEGLINEGKLVLVPVGDSRGYEVPPSSGVLITETQNFSIDLLRLILQRCAEDTVVIAEGDVLEQCDNDAYAGGQSGLRAMSKAFRGDSQFGQVELKNIYRSRTAKLADAMGRE